MKLRPCYICLNILGFISLVTAEACNWAGAIDGNVVSGLFDEYYTDLMIPEWCYITLMILLYLWLLIFTCDELRQTYSKEENRGLDDIGVKLFVTELFLTAGVICFCYKCFIAASIINGLAMFPMFGCFFVFSFHLKGRSELERHIWSNNIAFLLIWTMYFFVISMTAAIAKSGSSVASGDAWYYSWTSIICFFTFLTYGIMSPSIIACIFFGILYIGMATWADTRGTNSTFAYILAFVPIVFAILCTFIQMCCK